MVLSRHFQRHNFDPDALKTLQRTIDDYRANSLTALSLNDTNILNRTHVNTFSDPLHGSTIFDSTRFGITIGRQPGCLGNKALATADFSHQPKATFGVAQARENVGI